MQTSIKRKYQSYPTPIFIEYKLGCLPEQIPSSTLHNWKNRDLHKLFQYEYAVESEKKISLVKTAIQRKNIFRIIRAVNAAFKAYDVIISKVRSGKKLLFQSKDHIIPAIEKLKDIIGSERALKVFNISYQRLRAWKEKGKCRSSILCFKTYPLQISSKEQDVIKFYYKKYSPWDLKAIYNQMMKEGAAYMSPNSWYRHTARLGLRSFSPFNRRKKHLTGIRAGWPKQIIHMDVTAFRTLDNCRVYIYLIIDNFSRAILGCKVSREYRCSIALENLREAVEKHGLFKTGARIDLITDGGSENTCCTFNNFLELNSENIQRLIAQKDIIFSNSMIESVNKKIKYQYLYRKDMANFQAAEKYIPIAADNFGNKPHGPLFGYTPNEVLAGAMPDKYRFAGNITAARKIRIEENRKRACGVC
jgi:putative transposase